jgi:toxin ParE1/3/4
MINLEVHPLAKTEYDEALDWYAEKSDLAAQRFAIEVDVAIRAIQKGPETYARLDETHRFYLLKRFPYYVAYRQVQDRVEIIAIRHTSQDQDIWKTR